MRGIGGGFASARTPIAVLVVGVSCFVATAGQASAHTKRWSNANHYMYHDALGATPGFHGELEVHVAGENGPTACVHPRDVVLYEGDPAPGGTRTVIDSTTSYPDAANTTIGKWDVFGDFGAGTYFAIAKKEVLRRSQRHRHICEALRSNVVSIGSA